MEDLIPKLFILTAEASIVLFLILVVMIIFNIKGKRKDLNAVNELISDYVGNKEDRITALKNQLKTIGFKGNSDEQAEKLFQNEKTVIKEFVTLYLRRDTYRLLTYPETLIENNDIFLKTSGTARAATVTEAPESTDSEEERSEETASATILAREQAESNEAHSKELSELRLKNTELNEHLFEALETITALMTEHGKKTGQEVETNTQKVLEAIIYLRDKRLSHDNDPSQFAPSADNEHVQVDSFDLEIADDSGSNNADGYNNADGSSSNADGSISVDLASTDVTLDDSTAVNLGINDALNIDLDTLDASPDESTAINLEDTATEENDPWADALAEQASVEVLEDNLEVDTVEQDPWAEALVDNTETDAVEQDPWADALAEQAASEAETSEEEIDPWAEALAEQEKAEKK